MERLTDESFDRPAVWVEPTGGIANRTNRLEHYFVVRLKSGIITDFPSLVVID